MTNDGTAGLILFLESTTGAHGAALADASGVEVAAIEWTRADSRQDNLDDLFEQVMGDRIPDLGTIVVDAGPGNLATTRACVAYANAVGFALGVPVGSVNSLEVLSAGAGSGGEVVAFRRAGPHGFYASHSRGGRVEYALIDSLRLTELARPDRAVICSSDADLIAADRSGAKVGGAQVRLPRAQDVMTVWFSSGRRADLTPVRPITESAAMFRVPA